MTAALQIAAMSVVGANLLAALVAGLAWTRWEAGPWTWRAIRLGQAAALVLGVVALVLALGGFSPREGLFWLYVALPLAISFIAEQLRIASAEVVLEAKGLPDAQAVGRLPEDEQHVVVATIVRREVGVMAVAAAVVVFLALRALAEL